MKLELTTEQKAKRMQEIKRMQIMKDLAENAKQKRGITTEEENEKKDDIQHKDGAHDQA